MSQSKGLPKLPPRIAHGHKGTFGTVAVVGGCAAHPPADHEHENNTWAVHMVGGPAFAANAALRAGCGLARLAVPESILNAALTIAPSATGIALPIDDSGDVIPHSAAAAIDHLTHACDCVAVGPGLGTTSGAQSIVFRIVSQESCPAVVDADAINCLGLMPEIQRDFRAPVVLTPHPGEFTRFAQALGLSVNAGGHSKQESGAAELARYLGCIVVLKAAVTIVTDGHDSWSLDAPNSALATAGSGDVLTGVIASFIAQFTKPAIPAGSFTVTSQGQGALSLFDSTRLGVMAHSLAARNWVDQFGCSAGMLASDLLEEIPAAVQSLR